MEYFQKIINTDKKWYIFLFVISFLLYGNTLNNDYAIDDHYVANNEIVKKGIKGIPEIFTSYYAINENNNSYEYRPLVKTTFALEYQVFKSNPGISHFINILLYFFSLYLLYHFFKIFLTKSNFHLQLIVIVFAVIPAHTEVVASLKNRDILLCFDFALLTIITLDKYIIYRKFYFLIIGLFCCILAFLSKIEAVPFIVLTPVLFIKKYGFNLKKNGLTFFVFAVGYFSVVLIKQFLLGEGADHHAFHNFERPKELDHNPLLLLSTVFNCLGFYFKNLLFPSNLSCYYGLYTIPLNINIYFITGLIFGLILLIFFIKDLKKQNDFWVGILLFSLPISIYLQLIKPVPGIVADRFMFFASVGYVIMIGHVFHVLYNYLKTTNHNYFKYSSFVIVLAVGIYSTQTIKRNSEWKNKLTLFQADVKKWPNSIKLNIAFANEIIENINKNTGLIKPNQTSDYIKIAYKHLLKAYDLDSTYYNSLNTLAYIDLRFYNKPIEATHWLYKAQLHDTINYEIPLNMCLAYMRINNTDSVEKYYLKTLDLNKEIKNQLSTALNNYYVSTKQTVRISSFLQKN